MIKVLGQLGKSSVIYGLGSASSKILAFFLLPVYTHYLNVEDYGVLSLITTTATIISLIIQMGMGSALFWAILNQEIDERTSISTALFFLLIEGAVIFGILGLFTPQISNIIFDSREYSYLLQLTFTYMLLDAIALIFMSTLRIHDKAGTYALFSVIDLVASTAFKIGFVVFLKLGLDGIIYSNVIVSLILGVFYLLYLRPYIGLNFSWSVLRQMLSFGAPLITVGLSSLIMTSSDRYVLQEVSTTREVGLYTLGYNLGLGILMVVQAVQLAWPAQFLTIAKQKNAREQISQLTTYYFVVIAFLALVISILAREAVLILTTEQYYSAYVVVPLIVAAYVLHGMRHMVNIGPWLENKNTPLIPIMIFSALLNLVLNFLFIPRYGMLGAAWATIIAYGVLLILQLRIALRLYYISYEYNRIFKVAFVCVVFYVISFAFNVDNLWLALGGKILLLMLYPLALYAIRFYSMKELHFIRELSSRFVTQTRKQIINNDHNL